MKKILISVLAFLMLTACKTVHSPSPTESPVATPTPSPEVIEPIKLTPSTKSAKTDNLNKLKSCEFDIDKDGEDDTVTLYVDAKSDEFGQLMTDDGHEWLLEASFYSGDFYTLYSGRIQHGSLYFELSEFYNEEPQPTIITYMTTGAGLEIKKLSFKDSFTEELIYSTDLVTEGGTNRLYSSFPSYR